MKHSNLTYRDKILKWFDIHPNKINSLCEDNLHILDWIYGGYNGKTSAKIDLTNKLVNRKADLGLVKTETFKKILEAFVSISYSQEQSAIFVFQSLIKQKEQLKKVKADFSFINQLILTDLQWESPYREFKNKILYSDITEQLSLPVKNDVKTINLHSHPIVFLLQHYFFYLHEVRNHDTCTFLKIDKIHEFNEHIVLSKLPFHLDESIKESMEFLALEEQDNIPDMLNKIKGLKETKLNSFNSSILFPTIEAIGDTIKRDFYRNLKAELHVNNNKEHKIKL